MIREWRISRFKSIASTEALPFKPLTILAGPNSSGKSSVIQSILLVAQSLASQVPDRQLVLNGELVKLGTFDDVRNQQASEQTVEFGFDIDLDSGGSRVPLARGLRDVYYASLLRPMNVDIPRMTISANIVFGPAGDFGGDSSARPLQADVVTAGFRTALWEQQTEPSDDQGTQPDIAIERRTDGQIEQILTTINSGANSESAAALRQALRYSVELSQKAKQSFRRSRSDLTVESGEVVATRLEHFLPAAIVSRQRSLQRIVSSTLRRLSLGSQSNIEATLRTWAEQDDVIRSAFAAAVLELASAHDSSQTLGRYLRAARNDRETFDALIARVQALAGEAHANAMSAVEGPLPEEQGLAFQGLYSFFANLRYLGPLRDDPKPIYAMSGAVDPTDVGSKGQYTASVLDVNARMEVAFIAPGERDVSRARLSEAIRVWLQHFAMADAIRTTDEAKIGYKLLVRPTGIRDYVDLTNVGVGVSQVLPILVMALVSKPGSVLLFEQPELHLHPAIQSQLGDFFIALARSGRQCIVETHSEYLINRLRLRIAESDTAGDLAELPIVHFVERPGAASKFTPVVINEFGAIPDWPKGFFDQSPNESELILRAAMKKKSAIADTSRKNRG